jgi:uncharacterized protein (TIGR01777 family)
MTKHTLITGGTGFIGTRLCEYLLKAGHHITIFTRHPPNVAAKWGSKIRAIRRLDEIPDLEPIDQVVNLAGEPIVGKRWSEDQKHKISDSRIQVTRYLVSQLAKQAYQPEVMISGSAIGYYGDRGDEILTEQSEPGTGFSAQLCRDWEKAAQPMTFKKTRLCLLRTGIVLDTKGGALARMLGPFKMGLGGRIGNGAQWMSWINRDDLCRMIVFLLGNDQCSGPYNATAPDPVTNEIFSKLLGEHLHRPTFMPMPGKLVRLVMGESSELLLGSQRVIPEKALSQGFQFQFPDLESCLQHCLRTRQAS